MAADGPNDGFIGKQHGPRSWRAAGEAGEEEPDDKPVNKEAHQGGGQDHNGACASRAACRLAARGSRYRGDGGCAALSPGMQLLK